MDYTNYYRNALLYLACLPEPSPLSEDEARTRAYNLSIAALLGEKIYNFGELLLHPILDQLKTPEGSWLRELLFAMNSGDLDAFGKLLPQLPSNVPPFLGLLMVASSCFEFGSVATEDSFGGVAVADFLTSSA
jgi:26S proteasome regulatory subunit N9